MDEVSGCGFGDSVSIWSEENCLQHSLPSGGERNVSSKRFDGVSVTLTRKVSWSGAIEDAGRRWEISWVLVSKTLYFLGG